MNSIIYHHKYHHQPNYTINLATISLLVLLMIVGCSAFVVKSAPEIAAADTAGSMYTDSDGQGDGSQASVLRDQQKQSKLTTTITKLNKEKVVKRSIPLSPSSHNSLFDLEKTKKFCQQFSQVEENSNNNNNDYQSGK